MRAGGINPKAGARVSRPCAAISIAPEFQIPMEAVMLGSLRMCAAVVICLALLAGCGGGNGGGQSGTRLDKTVAVPGISSAVVYSFDLGTYDTSTNLYYVTDRTNKSIDVYDTFADRITQFVNPGFAGCRTVTGAPAPGCLTGVSNDNSGPDGIDVVGPYIFVGDVNALWIMNKTSGSVVNMISIPSNPTGLRADEGCFDPDDNIYAISTPADNNPFMTFVDTSTQSVIAKVVMNDSAGNASGGLEACVYDPATKRFYVNNDASTANPHGETDGIPAADIVALKPGGPTKVVNFTALAGIVTWALPALCDPTGIGRGPANDLGVMCRPGTLGAPMNFVILDVTSGKVTAQVPAGGGDQITYDSFSNQWFLADSRWTANGNSCGAGSATCPLTPVLGVVNGTSRSVVAMVPNGNNSHSVAASGSGRQVFTPFTAPSTAGGGAAFPNGGLNIFVSN
jgi:hypothetical protein